MFYTGNTRHLNVRLDNYMMENFIAAIYLIHKLSNTECRSLNVQIEIDHLKIFG